MMKLMRSRFAGLCLFALVFVAVSLALRTALLVRAWPTADKRWLTVCAMYLIGLGMDLVAMSVIAAPIVLLLVLPDRVVGHLMVHGLYYAD